MIFHLSYKFKNGNASINDYTPREFCTTKYNDLDHAIANSLRFLTESNKPIFYAKTDLQSAFRLAPLQPGQFFLVCMRAPHPVTGITYWFIEKCLPFGSGISCSHFQRLSNGLKHIVEEVTGRRHRVTNYLDDFLFLSGYVT